MQEIIKEYIKPELIVLIPMLYIVGAGLKNTEKLSDKYIPVILGFLGVIMATIYIIGTGTFTMLGVFTAVTQGILCAGASVYCNQLLKQSNK